ncbi:SnoaL-like domain-containing protein [Microdochium trichocladiopsis]|uniref:SnoaL-like domain-containing protein n=1 Tax=Microdochium trichocladiopsis TaxID=1682393 RepID=A0A9P8XZX4_9PEZI|nr:SnoaL-like domain-containing protein [Microdochium trichocladiopsis]KAH7024718.1 SnoaL-like domain-containing protein [Microdochium trichocladiopsis]
MLFSKLTTPTLFLAALSTASPLPAHTQSLPACPTTFTTSTAGIPAHEIASLFSSTTVPLHPSAAADIEHIRATVALYGIALDGKNWPMLEQVFTSDVRANYSAVGVMEGIEAIQTTLEASLEPVGFTQHQFSTTVIQLCRDETVDAATGEHGGAAPGKTAAVSIAYTTTAHFPVGPDGAMLPTLDAAAVLTGYVMYQDVWVKEEVDEGAEWRIRKRNTITMVSLNLHHWTVEEAQD